MWQGQKYKIKDIPPIISYNKTIFGPINHETILSQVRGAHLLCFGVFDPPLAPQKTYFYEKAQNMLKFGNFLKSRFLGVQRVFFWFWTLQNEFIYDYLLLMEDWRPKNATFQKFLHLENVIFNFFGGPGRSPSEKILPKMFPKG